MAGEANKQGLLRFQRLHNSASPLHKVQQEALVAEAADPSPDTQQRASEAFINAPRRLLRLQKHSWEQVCVSMLLACVQVLSASCLGCFSSSQKE